MPEPARSLPVWVTHALTWPRGPVPWGAVARAAAGAAVLPALLLSGWPPGLCVPAALGAMLATVNDRPGGRRPAVPRIGIPGVAGAIGLTLGTVLQMAGADRLVTTLALTAAGLLAGMVSTVGPVASAAATQLLITTAIGAGTPSHLSWWTPPAVFLAGAAWLLLLRLVLPGRSQGGVSFLDGERAAVAAAYLAVAELLETVGTWAAPARREALSAALDRAQEALGGPLLRSAGAAERRLHAQFGAVLPLAEAATALAWDGVPVPARLATAPRRLGQAVLSGDPCGPLSAPHRATAALRALDDAVLAAAHTFGSRDHTGRSAVPSTPRPGIRRVIAQAMSAAGREYGLRVALGTLVTTAVAMTLHPQHWYWLPVTAAFLVKPDLGPLFSRVLSRAAGTVAGALVSATWAALLPGTAGAVAATVLAAAFIPVAGRHFAGLTAAVTVLVLALVGLGSGPQAAVDRITDTLLACALVLAVGHLPIPGHRGRTLAARAGAAVEAAHRYAAGLRGDTPHRTALRRAAYRTLADARTAVDLARSEHPTLARHSAEVAPLVAELERLVDTTTAYAVRASQGEAHPTEVADLQARLHKMAAGL